MLDLTNEEMELLSKLAKDGYVKNKVSIPMFTIEYTTVIRGGLGSPIIAPCTTEEEKFVDESDMLIRLAQIKKEDVINIKVYTSMAVVVDKKRYEM